MIGTTYVQHAGDTMKIRLEPTLQGLTALWGTQQNQHRPTEQCGICSMEGSRGSCSRDQWAT